MPQATFPDPGPDDAEPDGFLPAADGPGPERGLYLSLPAEHLTLAGFCQGGAADTMAPGPLLATVVHTVTGQDRPASDQPPPDNEPPGSPGTGNGPGGPDGPGNGSGGSGGLGGPGPAPRPGPDAGPSLAALVTITIPLATYQGRSDAPGEAGGFGLLDRDDARDLAAAAARHPRTRWCVTALNPDGTAAAHGCLPGRHPPPGTGPPGHQHPPPGTAPSCTGPPGLLTTRMTPITRGPCDHTHAEVGYHPSRTLTHLVRARNATCTAPGCGRPAARCDLDHTTAWDKGGLTCECNMAPVNFS
jgi:hypothetical protein